MALESPTREEVPIEPQKIKVEKDDLGGANAYGLLQVRSESIGKGFPYAYYVWIRMKLRGLASYAEVTRARHSDTFQRC